MRRRLEYAAAWPFIKLLSLSAASFVARLRHPISRIVYLLHVRLRHVGMRNLAMAFPEKSEKERKRILRGEFTSLGRQLAELCQFPRYTRKTLMR